MDSVELVRKVWEKIYNPRSCVPDVEIGQVRQVLAQVLAESLDGSLPLEQEVDRYVLAALLIGPINGMDLDHEWFDIKYRKYPPQPADGDYQSKEYQRATNEYYEQQDELEAAGMKDVSDALARLVDKGLIEVRSDPESGAKRFCPTTT